MPNFVSTREAEQQRYVLLRPGVYPARTGPMFQQLCSPEDIDGILESCNQSEILALDFETRGGDYSDEISIVGLGLAWSSGSVYLHWADLSASERTRLLDSVSVHPGLIAHNVYFDGGVIRAVTGRPAQWHTCTYSLLAHLANEGHPDQYWGLKSAQTELLGWTDSNEHDLNRWLVVNGYYRGNRRIDNSPEYLSAEYDSGGLSPERGEMWRAPRDILGKYCVLDAEACYLLFTQVLAPTLFQFPDMVSYFYRDVMHLVGQLVEQKMHGIPVDRPGMLVRKEWLLREMTQLHSAFREHPKTRNYIRELEGDLREEIRLKEPERLKKDGQVSKNWIKWKARLDFAEAGESPDFNFNIQSQQQLRYLLYDRLGFEIRARTENGDPAVGIKTLKHMGEIGQLLIDRAYCAKELSYLEDYLARTETRATIHPSFRTPGTMTGRLSSKEPNVQQIPKSKAVMSLFTARPGHVWIDLDFAALEPVVLTEFSQDENLMRIYGNTAPKNDIYLYVAASIPTYSAAIRATGYDPYNPTPDGLVRAKAECKAIRSICKTVVLACQYGAGVNKIMQTLEQDDVFLSYEEVALIHKSYWDTFAGVRDFSRSLYYEWKRNGGWILNGVGRPMAIPEHMTKDILNRFVQSTGHDILVKYIRILTERLDQDIPGGWTPLIIDWHDAAAIEVPEYCVNQARIVMIKSVDQLNAELCGTIKLRGEPDIGINLAEIKRPEE